MMSMLREKGKKIDRRVRPRESKVKNRRTLIKTEGARWSEKVKRAATLGVSEASKEEDLERYC